MNNMSDRVRQFVVENFLYGDDRGLTNQTSFIDEGIIDSMGILELVDYIDKEFHIRIADEEILPENLDSIEKIINFLKRKVVFEHAS